MNRKLFWCALLLTLFFQVSLRGQTFGKFEIADNPLQLTGTVRPGVFCEAIGRKAALLGSEDGIFESWVFPFKILHDLHFSILLENQVDPIPASRLARRIIVRPEGTTIIYSHPSFTIRQHLLSPLESAGSLILFDVETDVPFTLIANFIPDLQPMWPAGLGGQFSYWDDGLKAYVISESRWKYSGAIGCPFGRPLSAPPAHQLSSRPVQFAVDVTPQLADENFIPIILAGSSEKGLKALKATYRDLAQNAESLYLHTREHYRWIRTKLLDIETPDERFNLALEWAKVAIDKGFVENPHLGRGLVAGFGRAGKGGRPGFAWFFGGDGLLNSMAIVASGNHPQAKEVLAFLIKYQRDDGKIMHELSQSAGMIDWFGEWHFGYMHGETTPLFLVQLEDYARASGDVAFIKDHWENIERAYRWCLGCDSDGDGLIENPKAGLGASEVGSLRQNIHTDVYLAGVWVRALEAMPFLAKTAGRPDVAKEARKKYRTALATLNEQFWNEEKELVNFALGKDGSINDELTAWSAVPMIFSLLPPERGRAMVRHLISPALTTDWGVRMLASTSPAYDPLAYNNGAVWPFLTGLVALAEYRYQRPDAGFFHLQALTNLFFEDALGYQPEILSGNRFRVLDTSVPHQLFSTSQFYQAFVRGLLGLQADALTKEIHFSPQMPDEWSGLEIKNFIVGHDTLRFELNRSDEKWTLRVQTAASDYSLSFSALLPAGSRVRRVTRNHKALDFETSRLRESTMVRITCPIEPETLIEIHL